MVVGWRAGGTHDVVRDLAGSIEMSARGPFI